MRNRHSSNYSSVASEPVDCEITGAQWLQSYCHSQTVFPPLFDLRCQPVSPVIRSATLFQGVDGDDKQSLLARQHELPPPVSRIATIAAVLCDTEAASALAAEALRSRGYRHVVTLTADLVAEQAPSLVSPCPLLSRALWTPSPSVLALLPQVAASLDERSAIDIGAGSGRDAAYLAYNGWSVTAVDRDAGLVLKAEQLGNRVDQGGEIIGVPLENVEGDRQRVGRVKGVVRTFGADLDDDGIWLSKNSAKLLVVVRFLRRGVLELLPRGVQPGGFVLIEHFLTGCELFGGPMKRSQLLERGELGRVFAPQNFTILIEEECTLSDGRPVVRFLAHRRSQ